MITILFLISVATIINCGPRSRKLSRLTGSAVKIKLPKDCVKVMNISIGNESKGGNQVKNVTYINSEGDLVTKEYTDWGLLEGSIIWTRHDGSPYSTGNTQ